MKLAAEAFTVIVAKGQRVVRFDMRHDPPDEATLLAHLLGPTGNLRAPALRAGRTLFVGFNADAFGTAFG